MRPQKTKLRGISNFIHTNDWVVKFNKLPSKVSVGFNLNEDIQFRATSIAIPKRTTQEIEINVRGQKIRIPGDVTLNSPIDLEFYENVDQKVIELIKAWNEAIMDLETGVSKGTPEELKTDITLIMYNRQGKPIRTYTLKGCWISDFQPPQLGSDDDAFRGTVSIQFDTYEEKKS